MYFMWRINETSRRSHTQNTGEILYSGHPVHPHSKRTPAYRRSLLSDRINQSTRNHFNFSQNTFSKQLSNKLFSRSSLAPISIFCFNIQRISLLVWKCLIVQITFTHDSVSVFLNIITLERSKYKMLVKRVFIAQSTGFKDKRPTVEILHDHLLDMWSCANCTLFISLFPPLWNCDSKVTYPPGNLRSWNATLFMKARNIKSAGW